VFCKFYAIAISNFFNFVIVNESATRIQFRKKRKLNFFELWQRCTTVSDSLRRFFFLEKRRREFLYNSNGWNCSQPSGCRETTKVRLNSQIPLNFESTFAFMRTVFLQYTQRLFLSRCRGELGFVQHKALVGEKNEIAIPRCSDW